MILPLISIMMSSVVFSEATYLRLSALTYRTAVVLLSTFFRSLSIV